jgi:hypothetical protein
MKGISNPIKGVSKNTWFILIALGIGYLLYRNIHRN